MRAGEGRRRCHWVPEKSQAWTYLGERVLRRVVVRAFVHGGSAFLPCRVETSAHSPHCGYRRRRRRQGNRLNVPRLRNYRASSAQWRSSVSVLMTVRGTVSPCCSCPLPLSASGWRQTPTVQWLPAAPRVGVSLPAVQQCLYLARPVVRYASAVVQWPPSSVARKLVAG